MSLVLAYRPSIAPGIFIHDMNSIKSENKNHAALIVGLYLLKTTTTKLINIKMYTNIEVASHLSNATLVKSFQSKFEKRLYHPLILMASYAIQVRKHVRKVTRDKILQSNILETNDRANRLPKPCNVLLVEFFN